MWIPFLLENVHFAVHLFAALVFFAVFWLYLDAWQANKEAKTTIRLIGFLILSFSFLIEAIVIESTIIQAPLLFGVSPAIIASVTRVVGYFTLILGLLMDPIQGVPSATRASAMAVLGSVSVLPIILEPIGAVLVGLLYLKRATIGLEDHLKPLSLSFFLLSISELLSISTIFQTSSNVSVFQFATPFGPIWIASVIVLLIAVFVLCKWVFGYLLKQFQAQLFMIYTTTILFIFLVTTVAFTGLLLQSMEKDALSQIATDVRVLDFALGSQREQLISDAQTLAINPLIVTALEKNDRKALGDITTSQIISKRFTSFLILSESGQVLARGEDRDRIGDSLSHDSLVKRALLGESYTTVDSKEGVIAPDLFLRSTAVIKSSQGAVMGIILIGKGIDTAFVDGMKKTTGLDASVYGNMTVAATTFVSPDGVTRVIGMKESHEEVRNSVMQKGEIYTGAIPMRGVEYTSAFLPLKDVDRNPVGMLFVGRPQVSILQAAGASIQYTFLITVLLLVLSVFPAYWISRFIADQL